MLSVIYAQKYPLNTSKTIFPKQIYAQNIQKWPKNQWKWGSHCLIMWWSTRWAGPGDPLLWPRRALSVPSHLLIFSSLSLRCSLWLLLLNPFQSSRMYPVPPYPMNKRKSFGNDENEVKKWRNEQENLWMNNGNYWNHNLAMATSQWTHGAPVSWDTLGHILIVTVID